MNQREEAALEAFFARFVGAESAPLGEEHDDGAGMRRCWELLRDGACFEEVMRMRAVLADESLSDEQCVAAIRRIGQGDETCEMENLLLL